MNRIFIVTVFLVLILSVASSAAQQSDDQKNYLSTIRGAFPDWNFTPYLESRRDIIIDAAENTLALPQRENSLNGLGVTNDTTDELLGLDKRYLYNCTDPAADWDSRCWAELNLSGYLNDPVKGWNQTIRICGGRDSPRDDDGSDCCKSWEPWTTCFLRLAHGGPGQDCSQINAQDCVYHSNLADNLSPEVRPKVQYLMKNIYAINDFFTTYYIALGGAQADAQTVIQALVNELDPVVPTHWNLLDLFTALSVGLAFLGAPSIAVTILGTTFWARVPAQILLVSLQQSPSTAKALWPTGTTNSQNIQVANIESVLGNSTNQLAGMINNAVLLLMTDVPTFVKFCENGMWSGSQSLSLPSKVEGLDYALRTYMASEVMGQNGWYAIPFVGPYQTITDVENPISGFSCQMDANNVCTTGNGAGIFWSQATGNVYMLQYKGKSRSMLSSYALLQDTVANNWAILEVLFDGAFNCTLEGHFGESVVNFNWDGTLNIACISQLPMRIGCGSPCPVPLNLENGDCPFNDAANPCLTTFV